jgi:BirA family transcriptional regulator, biotin operon repressor / biotin---[acetyl-CoA-carboxylase] ligase
MILDALRKSGTEVSGSDLGDALGMSRVAVHKHVEGLRASGYGVSSGNRGYRLISDGDFLFPWEEPGREADIDYHETIGSTMDRAWALALERPGKPWIVIAETQDSGRGRRSRHWDSRPGGLFFTVLLPLSGPAQRRRDPSTRGLPPSGEGVIARAGMAASIALCEAARECAGADAGVQWPNDVYSDGKKLGGVLVEITGSPEEPRTIAAGIGINVRNRVPEGAVGLDAVGRKGLPRRLILARFLDSFFAYMDGGGELSGIWNGFFLGKGMAVTAPDGGKLGTAMGIREDGMIMTGGRSRKGAYGPGRARVEGKGGEA